MKALWFVLILLVASSCASNKPLEFNVSVDEMTAAIYKFRESKNNVLYLLLVDRNGDVVKFHYIEDKLNTYIKKDRLKVFSKQDKIRVGHKLQRTLKYSKSERTEYRNVFHAIKYKESVHAY